MRLVDKNFEANDQDKEKNKQCTCYYTGQFGTLVNVPRGETFNQRNQKTAQVASQRVSDWPNMYKFGDKLKILLLSAEVFNIKSRDEPACVVK